MMVIRPIKPQDVEAFIKIAFTAGLGMTSMPKNRAILEELVNISAQSFAADIKTPGNERYLFVLEDLDTGIINGTCSVIAKRSQQDPFYFYHIDPPIPQNNNLPMLHVTKYDEEPTELSSLYLMPTCRHGGLGRLLSLSRFLFIACHRHRFESTVYAEMRGYADSEQNSPFWEGIGRHFLEMEFSTLMNLRNEEDFDITRVLPLHPIYIPLLPQPVQDTIGHTHPHTEAALQMLLSEGFHRTDEVDVCDGGPKIEALTDQIRSIKDSVVATVKEITNEPIDAPCYIISNTEIDYRACMGAVGCFTANGIVLNKEVAKTLNVELGDSIRYVLAHGAT